MTTVADETLAETRAFNAELERQLATRPPTHELPVEVTRRQRRDGTGIFPLPVYLPERARELSIDGRSGPIGLRVIAPESKPAAGVYLHMHGGGWALSAADLQDPVLVELADETGLCVVSVEYRLAPEHPYPAGPDDCEDAALWLLREGLGALGLPPVATIGGDSAGGHLSVLTLLRLRDQHGITGAFVGGQPHLRRLRPLDDAEPAQLGRAQPHPLDAGHRVVRRPFLPGMDPEARRDPAISPLYADLRDMPPALFSVGTLDPLLDDSLFMEARWRAAGAPTALRLWPEAIHGFNAFPLRVTAAARAQQYAFLRDAIGA